ncbi:MAG: Alkyl hydroperoxide reductase subunit F [Parcubacteria group bacterium GW2011_GWA1_59_11]|nr:MAG: Alkyl hydroperoxide reductase subunit F [Parcubacteria group bacterium GW2011_GWA1_59_11]
MTVMQYDLIIAGGGPAGAAGGVYAARKKMKTLLVAESFGGQSIVSNEIQNWIGTKAVSGLELAGMLEGHLRAQEGLEIEEGERIAGIRDMGDGLEISAESGKKWLTKYLLLATGSRRRKLGIPGEKEMDGKGVAYCSICDAPIFKDKDVAIVGGGNAGLEAVLDSLPYARKIYLLERGEELKGDAVTQEKIGKDPKVQVITRAETLEIIGEQFVSGLRYKDGSGEIKELAVQGVFVEIGAVPNSDPAKGVVEMNRMGEVVVDHKTQRTSHPRIWAAGDVSDVLYKQNNISAGDAVKAVLNIYEVFNRT